MKASSQLPSSSTWLKNNWTSDQYGHECAQKEGNQPLPSEKFSIQQACLDIQKQPGFCFHDKCCLIVDTKLQEDYQTNEKAHHELWLWSDLHHYEYLELWSTPLATFSHWRPYNRPSETEYNFPLVDFWVCEQNVVKVFSSGPYHQLSNLNIYSDYHNINFDACTTFSFRLFVVRNALEVLWQLNLHNIKEIH